MATITITKENFWQKMSMIYKKVNTNWKVKIQFETNDDWDEFTEKNKKAYLQAKKDLEQWNTTKIDFNKIKNENDFITLIKS